MTEEEMMESLGGFVSVASNSIRDCKDSKCTSLNLSSQTNIEDWADISELTHLTSLDLRSL